MNTRRLVPLYCSATLFLAGIAGAQPAVSPEEGGPALAPPVHHEHPLTAQEQELLKRYDKNGDGKLDAAELDTAHGAAYQAKLGRDVIARQIYDRLLEQYDTAHEGKLNADQQKQAVDFLQANRPRIFEALVKQFDRNADGKLDAGETTALFQYFSNLPSDLDVMQPGGARPPGALAEPPAPPKPATAPATPPPAPTQPNAPGARVPPAAPATAPAPDLSALLDAVPATPPPKTKGAKAGGGGAMGGRFYGLLLQKFDHDHQGSLTPAEQAEAMAYLSTNNPRLYERLLTRFDRNGDGQLDAGETAAVFTRLAKSAEKASQ